MSEVVSVKSIDGEGNPWQHGITYYPVTFDRAGQDFSCSWGKKGDPPTVGEEVEGDFSQRNGEWKFSKASKPQGGSSSSAGSSNFKGGGGGGQYQKPPDPAAAARMGMSAAHGHALEAIKVEGGEQTPQELKALIVAWTDWFTERVNAAGKAAKGGELTGGADAASAASAPDSPPVPQSSDTQGVHEKLYACLIARDVDGAAATAIADYFISEQDPAAQDAAIERLENPNMASACVARCRELTEAHLGGALPSEIDEEIPFARPLYPALFSERECRSNRSFGEVRV